MSDPALAVLLIVWDARVLGTGLHVVFLSVVIGAGAWTIAEYAVHRWVYHARTPRWRVGHEMHHESPERLIGIPWFATASLIGGYWYIFAYTLRVHGAASTVAGFLAGFVIHGVLHHSHHHRSLGVGWCRSLRTHHRVASTNFGVTTRLWDYLCGTGYRKPGRQAR